MSAHTILERLKASGLHIRVEGDNLRVGPRESVTPETLDLIREHKAELLRVVKEAHLPPMPELEAGIRRMAAAWGYSPEELIWALEKAGEDPAGWSELVRFDSERFRHGIPTN